MNSPWKQCIKCLRFKPLEDFPKHASMKDGHMNSCKCCKHKYQREHRKKQHDFGDPIVHQMMRAWR